MNSRKAMSLALDAMVKKAIAYNLKGSASVAFWFREKEMLIIASKTSISAFRQPDPSRNPEDKGTNRLSVGLGKIAEMVRTEEECGSPNPMRGEYGLRGGRLLSLKDMILFAAFSGGSDVQDLEISDLGMEWLKQIDISMEDF